jgi:hypothetical protein
MKFLSLDSSGEIPPLDVALADSQQIGLDIPVFGLEGEAPLPDLQQLERHDPSSPSTDAAAAESSSTGTDQKVRIGDFWLDGDTIMCGCPDCKAPITIRHWLMIADCWRCQASMLIGEEQEREIRQLLDMRQRDGTRSRPSEKRKKRVAPPVVPSYPAPRPSMAQKRVREQLALAETDIWITRIFRDTPAWIISLLFHIVMLLLLGLLELPRDNEGPKIVLSVVVGPDRTEGGEVIKTDPKNPTAYDLPIPKNVDPNDPEQMKQVMADKATAEELHQDFDTLNPNVPRLDEVKRKIREATGTSSTILARDPRVRVEMVKREGGTTRTEAAVARGLRWLSTHQEADGRWSLRDFNHAADCNCGHPGQVTSDSAATSLALLPFLGAGQTHMAGKYKKTVQAGLDWLLKNQNNDGDLSPGSTGNTRMYAHGQGAIVLSEAFMLTGDENLRGPSQKAIDFIVASQHEQGGWRYRPGDAGDTSVLGWQVMALQSARMANLYVPPYTLQKAQSYLDRVVSNRGAFYSYIPDQRKAPTYTMTAEGLLCRMYLGWTLEYPGLKTGAQHLLDNHPPTQKPRNMYYLYYATQALHHIGGEHWNKWNTGMRQVLVESQEKSGHMAGSWTPVEQHDRTGGRLYSTSMAICCLEIYYRHLPLFDKINLD